MALFAKLRHAYRWWKPDPMKESPAAPGGNMGPIGPSFRRFEPDATGGGWMFEYKTVKRKGFRPKAQWVKSHYVTPYTGGKPYVNDPDGSAL